MVGEVMEDGVRGHEVERVVLEGELLGEALVQGDVAAARVDAVQHRPGGVETVDLVEGVAQEVDHEAGAAADVEQTARARPAPRPGGGSP